MITEKQRALQSTLFFALGERGEIRMGETVEAGMTEAYMSGRAIFLQGVLDQGPLSVGGECIIPQHEVCTVAGFLKIKGVIKGTSLEYRRVFCALSDESGVIICKNKGVTLYPVETIEKAGGSL